MSVHTAHQRAVIGSVWPYWKIRASAVMGHVWSNQIRRHITLAATLPWYTVGCIHVHNSRMHFVFSLFLQLCVRGLIHVFKYLDTMAIKEEKSRGGTGLSVFDGHTTLRRKVSDKVSTRVIDSPKLRQQLSVESNINVTNDVPTNGSTPDSESYKWSPTSAHNRTLTNDNNTSPSTPNSSHSNSSTQDQFDGSFEKASNGSQKSNRSNGGLNNNRFVNEIDFVRRIVYVSITLPAKKEKNMPILAVTLFAFRKIPFQTLLLIYAFHHLIDFMFIRIHCFLIGNPNPTKNSHIIHCSTDVSPDGFDTPESQKSGDRLKTILGNVQTYRLVISFSFFFIVFSVSSSFIYICNHFIVHTSSSHSLSSIFCSPMNNLNTQY